MTKQILVDVGGTEFQFNVDNAEYNKFINSMTGGRAIQSSYNLLTRTVIETQRTILKELLTDNDNQPIGSLVLEIQSVVSEEFSNSLPSVVKLQTSSSNSVRKTV